MKKKVGRPIGYKLSKESKNKIAESHRGLKHTQETKDKIGLGVIRYFSEKHLIEKENL